MFHCDQIQRTFNISCLGYLSKTMFGYLSKKPFLFFIKVMGYQNYWGYESASNSCILLALYFGFWSTFKLTWRSQFETSVSGLCHLKTLYSLFLLTLCSFCKYSKRINSHNFMYLLTCSVGFQIPFEIKLNLIEPSNILNPTMGIFNLLPAMLLFILYIVFKIN